MPGEALEADVLEALGAIHLVDLSGESTRILH